MKIRPFDALRSYMRMNHLENSDIANLLGKTPEHVSRCLNNKAQWTLSDQYTIMRAIHRPAEELHVVFPEGGRNETPAR